MQNVPGNYYNKYDSKNPVEKWLVKGFFDSASRLFNIVKKDLDPTRILDAGCGEGVFTAFMRSIFPKASFDAFDLEDSVIDEATNHYGDLRIHFYTGSIYETNFGDSSIPLVVCSEVLEHLEDPEKALAELKRICSSYILLSVPEEPIWRILNLCRFKYIKDLGNTPGHINHYSKKRFLDLIQKIGGLDIVMYVKTLPWQMVLLHRKFQNCGNSNCQCSDK